MATNSTRLGFGNSTARWLIVLGVLWAAAYWAYRASFDVPVIPRMRPFADLSWGNWIVAGVLVLLGVGHALWPRKAVPSGRIGNRWAGPAMVTSGVLGLLWIVLYYTLSGTGAVPYLSDAIDYFGDWNLIFGMGLIMAAFGFAMKWE